jgi:hypothetical protein
MQRRRIDAEQLTNDKPEPKRNNKVLWQAENYLDL